MRASHSHGHAHGCAADHHRGEYTERQRVDLDLVREPGKHVPVDAQTGALHPKVVVVDIRVLAGGKGAPIVHLSQLHVWRVAMQGDITEQLQRPTLMSPFLVFLGKI